MKKLLAHLRTVGTPTIFRKNTSIFFQGEIPRDVIIVLDGVVKGYTITPDGGEAIVNLYGKGSVIPLEWANDQAPNSLFNYDAINDVRVLRVTKQSFLNAIDLPELQSEYLQFLMKNQANLMLRITGLCQSRAAEKICYTLYFLASRYGIERKQDIYEIDLKITQGMLANLIGQTRESTAKNLKTLKSQNILDYSTSSYTINKRKLESYLGEDSFRTLLQD